MFFFQGHYTDAVNFWTEMLSVLKLFVLIIGTDLICVK